MAPSPFHTPITLSPILLFFLLSGVGLVPRASAQQPYGSAVEDCYKQHNESGLLGYFCSTGAAPPSCRTYLTFTARPPYTNFTSIAALLGVDAAALAAANSGSGNNSTAIAAGTKLVVPATCSCTSTPEGRFYQRDAPAYVARPGDTLMIIANAVFQGLSTCQALRAQALAGAPPESLLAGQPLPAVPMRCACPTAAQAAKGTRFLVTYLVSQFDEVEAVAARFGVDQEDVVAANRLRPPFTIFPGTTLLVPVAAPPNMSQVQSTHPPPPPPPPPVAESPPTQKNSSNKHTGVYIGVGVAVAAVVIIASAAVFLACKAKRKRRAGAILATTTSPPPPTQGEKVNERSGVTSSTYTTSGGGEVSVSSFSDAFSSSISMSDIKSSLKVYTYAELRAATDDFSPARRINGSPSVYRAEFNGDAAAVEAVDRDVLQEVEIMRKVNHLNLVRLVGLCHHRGRWYLVTEFAEHGSLQERLTVGPPMTWAQRVQVGLDVAEGLRYLHEYADPPCVHMDVSSGAVLLAGAGPRAKLRGFAAARAIAGAGGQVEFFTMTSRIAGTRGYMAPEYLEHGVVSPKADVFSLGVVLLELVTGKDVEDLVGRDGVGDPFVELRQMVVAAAEDEMVRRTEELVDPALQEAGSCPMDAVVMMVRLIERCVRRSAAERPAMGEVARQLLKMSGVSALSWQSSSPPDRPESPRSPGR